MLNDPNSEIENNGDSSSEDPILLEKGHPDLIAFRNAATTMHEIAVKNRWPLVISGFAPTKVGPGVTAIEAVIAAYLTGKSAAGTFAMAKEKGVMMAVALKECAEKQRVFKLALGADDDDD